MRRREFMAAAMGVPVLQCGPTPSGSPESGRRDEPLAA